MKPTDLVNIREAVVSDEAFIFSTWLLGLYYGDSWFSKLDKNYFMQEYHKVIENLLSRSTIKIACLKEDENVIIGYSVYDENTLHWVFVKKDFRKINIAKSLVPSNIKVVTHATKVGHEILKKKKDLKLKPFNM